MLQIVIAVIGKVKPPLTTLVLALLALVLFTAGSAALSQAAEPLGVPDREDIEYPDDEPPSDAELELGKTLFFDPRLSGNNRLSCASCHNPDLGFGDGLALGLGTQGNRLTRHTPHLYNLAWNTAFLWDGGAESLEEQVLEPIAARNEMSMPLDRLMVKLSRVPYYRNAFAKVYPEAGLIPETIARAIAAFERTLISDNSPFDRYMKGDPNAMSAAAIRGMKLFEGKANCIACHSGPNFTNESFHNLGLGDEDPARAAIVADDTLRGAFKTPGLRNVLLTAPYMHDGSLATLEAVVQFYNAGERKGATTSKLIKPLHLSETEIFDLVAFLGALTDPVIVARPEIPAGPDETESDAKHQ
ncbi:cytochrome-c peroxidase [Candidatus Entotheonella palauensis]|uniref:cytochrome-c peroxidase n=1 Tax=Candidatus Entotheonella palauensis TaxID=93172 RepID=UPI000B7E9A85|nr:cytochrome c peroxidase [Candidatus Entotheonella palauensis]